jgi:hypothetical protein
LDFYPNRWFLPFLPQEASPLGPHATHLAMKKDVSDVGVLTLGSIHRPKANIFVRTKVDERK